MLAFVTGIWLTSILLFVLFLTIVLFRTSTGIESFSCAVDLIWVMVLLNFTSDCSRVPKLLKSDYDSRLLAFVGSGFLSSFALVESLPVDSVAETSYSMTGGWIGVLNLLLLPIVFDGCGEFTDCFHGRHATGSCNWPGVLLRFCTVDSS